MLSDKSAQVIRDTLPAVGAAIGEITECSTRSVRRPSGADPGPLQPGKPGTVTSKLAFAGSIATYATMLV